MSHLKRDNSTVTLLMRLHDIHVWDLSMCSCIYYININGWRLDNNYALLTVLLTVGLWEKLNCGACVCVQIEYMMLQHACIVLCSIIL